MERRLSETIRLDNSHGSIGNLAAARVVLYALGPLFYPNYGVGHRAAATRSSECNATVTRTAERPLVACYRGPDMTNDDTTSNSRERIVRALMGGSVDCFFESLVRFVSAFSEVEVNLQTVVWHFAGVSTPMAQAIFSNVRVDGAMNLISRIADAQNWSEERRTELRRVFSHLGEINKLRNDILHYGARLTGPDLWKVSNELFVHLPDRIRETQLSASILENATGDLHQIVAYLVVAAWGDQMPAPVHASFVETAKHAWRYKPQQQVSTGRKIPKVP